MATFRKATKSTARLRMALVGPSGSGKTYSALAIATGLGSRIAVIDTEHGSASKYAGADRSGNVKFAFDVLELGTFDPRGYIEAIQAAESEGYDVVIIDSLTHAWSGKGGALELVDKAAKKSRSNNTYTAWRDVTPLHNALVDAIIASRCHVIATMRSKVEYALEADPNTGKMSPKKIGMAPIQREGMDYEFDVVCDMDLDHNLIVGKTRYQDIDGQIVNKPGRAFGKVLAEWLSDGVPARTANLNGSNRLNGSNELSGPNNSAPQNGQAPASDSYLSNPSQSLPADMANNLRRLIALCSMTDFQVRGALAKRGVSEIERLSVTDAQTMIHNLEHIASRTEFAEMVGGKPTDSQATQTTGAIDPSNAITADSSNMVDPSDATDSHEIPAVLRRAGDDGNTSPSSTNTDQEHGQPEQTNSTETADAAPISSHADLATAH
jgi:hypothetical protein